MVLPRYHENSYAHFVTTNTFARRRIFERSEYCKILLKNLWHAQKLFIFDVIAYCIMPDHFHLIVHWDVEHQPNLTISSIMRMIKSNTARQIIDYFLGRQGPLTLPYTNPGQVTRVTRGGVYPNHRMSNQTHRIWQPSFYDFNIYSDQKLRQKIEYVHWNPVRAGLCTLPENWPWSSVRAKYNR